MIILGPDLNNCLIIISKDYFCALYRECIPAHKKNLPCCGNFLEKDLHTEHKICPGNFMKGKECDSVPNSCIPEQDRFTRSEPIVVLRVFHPKIRLFNVYNSGKWNLDNRK
jgi:hypothetical protein